MDEFQKAIHQNYKAYFDEVNTTVISKEAQEEMLKRPQSWNRYYEKAILNAINDGELPKSEARFFQAYFEDAHERISYKSLETIADAMKEAGVKLDMNGDDIVIQSNRMDKVTLLGWLADLFPKHG